MIKEISKISCIYPVLPEKIRNAITAIPESQRNMITEIRLRAGRKLSVSMYSREYYVNPNGSLMNTSDNSVSVEKKEVEFTYSAAFHNSLHSFKREITGGYATLQGGNRMGLCGTAVLSADNNYRVENIKNISSLNIRIAREMIGCADEIYSLVFSQKLKSLLIAGPPSSGKTTLLRDLTRILSQRYTISLIDERNELSAACEGIPQNNVGSKTDIFSSYNKYEGIMTAVRVMSPQIIVCDEIGAQEDLTALEYALNSGVKLISTCHAASYKELCKRHTISKLFKKRAFDECVILGCGMMCGKVTDRIKLGGAGDDE